MWLPIANKLKRIGEDEVHNMDIILEGIMSIQAGANPRVIEQKLMAFVPEKLRPVADEKAA